MYYDLDTFKSFLESGISEYEEAKLSRNYCSPFPQIGVNISISLAKKIVDTLSDKDHYAIFADYGHDMGCEILAIVSDKNIADDICKKAKESDIYDSVEIVSCSDKDFKEVKAYHIELIAENNKESVTRSAVVYDFPGTITRTEYHSQERIDYVCHTGDRTGHVYRGIIIAQSEDDAIKIFKNNYKKIKIGKCNTIYNLEH